ncbi:MAG: DNA polymerase III subunit alpha, partial [Anaerolineales bacterium]|nr:DNA polymerase III subunit alpha [Anaerolineales bacterium]
IDLDYPDDVRHLMVAYTKRRYGEEKVAQIITFGTLGARAAIRDVGRAMDLALPEVDGIARLVPAIPGKPVKIENVLDPEHEFFSAELTERYRREQDVRTLLDTARNLEGVARHASSHAAGVIVSDRPLHEYVPLNRPTSGDEGLGGVDRVTQWPMEIVESIGLLKVDFLGLSTLTVMRRAARLIEARYGIEYTMDNIPYDVGHDGPDPAKRPEALFDMLGRGEVAGVFQVEGAGMRRLMMEMRPHRFDHIVAAISLYRPGPMENIPTYIRRMHNEEPVEFHHPDLEPILGDTYGICIYQEQIIQMASNLAGYEPGEADMIRKAVAKKKKDLMEKHRIKFTQGAMSRGYSEAVCQAIWGDIEFFARYGFNRAHAADYAKVTCQTAFLKAHYPVEYLTAMLSVERDNTDKVRRYFQEAKNLNIDIAPPDVNRSMLDFTIEDDGERPRIRFGMGAIKNAGEGAVNAIIDERVANGRFPSLQALCDRVDLHRVGKRALEFMIKARVFDTWGTPVQMLDALDRIVSYSGTTHRAAAAGQLSLFGSSSPVAATMKVDLLQPLAGLEQVPHKQQLEWEKEALGVHVSEHPLERPLRLMSQRTNATISDITRDWNGKPVILAGVISQLRTLTTKKGDPMAFGTLEDLEHKIEVVFFPRTWKQVRDDVAVDQVLLLWGKVQVKNGDDEPNIIVDTVKTTFELAQAAEDDAPPLREAAYAPPPPAYAAPPVQRTTPAPVRSTPAPVKHAPAAPAAAVKTAVAHTTANHAADGLAAGARTAVSAPSPATPPADPYPDAGFGGPPPPPDDDFFWPAEARPAASKAAAAQPPAGAAPPQTNGTAEDGRLVFGQQAAAARAVRPKTIVVDIKPVGNWKEACRQALKLAAQFEGEEQLRLRLSGQSLAMDFPDQHTQSCAELIEQLERIHGVMRVSEQ